MGLSCSSACAQWSQGWTGTGLCDDEDDGDEWPAIRRAG